MTPEERFERIEESHKQLIDSHQKLADDLTKLTENVTKLEANITKLEAAVSRTEDNLDRLHTFLSESAERQEGYLRAVASSLDNLMRLFARHAGDGHGGDGSEIP